MSSSVTTLGLLKPFDAYCYGQSGRWIVPLLITEKAWWDGTVPNRPGVSIKTLIEADVKNITAKEAEAWNMGRDGGGAIIPYRRYDSRKLLFVEKIVTRKRDGKKFNFGLKKFGRLRLAEIPLDEDGNPKDKKYDQAAGTGTQIYVPPQFPKGHVEILILVEGEFKALCLTENGWAVIGLSGITGWSLKTEDGIRRILPALLEIIHKTKPKKIFYLGDNDVATNGDFYREVALFVQKLTEEKIEVPVFLPRWSLAMPKGVDDVRSTMSADEFASWWTDVAAHAIPVPSGTTAAQLGQALLNSCGAYVATCTDADERAKLLQRLARIHIYHKRDSAFKTWLEFYIELCGYTPAQLDVAVESEQEKLEEKRKAKNDGFTPSASIPVPPLLKGTKPEVISPKMAAVVSMARKVMETRATSQPIPALKASRTKGRSLVEFAAMDIDPYQTLLGNRFLCREGALIVIGPSGIGKSSASIQQDMMWCQGLPAFGISPAQSLKILGVQAENDDGDMTEVSRGVIAGLGLTENQLEIICQNTEYHTVRTKSGNEFLKELEHLLAAYQPDLLRLDPLQAFLGADPTDTDAVARFLRAGLSVLLEKFNCGAIIAHHTPKTNYRDTRAWKPHDWAYAGAGCADLTNWARAIIVIDPTDTPKTYRFITAKRDARMEWFDDRGNPVREKFFAHAKEPDAIFWEEVAVDALPSETSARTKMTADVLLSFFKEDEPILKKELIDKANKGLEIGINKVGDFIDILLASKKLEVVKVPRSGEAKRPWVYLKLATDCPPPVVVNDGHEQPPLITTLA